MGNIEKIIDAVTGEEILKPYSPEQLTEVEAAELVALERLKVQSKAATDKAALLTKLGITADEAKLLLG